MRFFKRTWDDSRGDEFDDWGTATYYFETDDELLPERQVEVYENGNVLTYDESHLNDEYGSLGDQALAHDDFKPFEIAEAEFLFVWTQSKALNR